ncbi:hypothetical protein [Streptomyces sp. NBC_01546]|uniref:hypothetical protein n=1 Tax=Streptomyces sp. NBC_01546 TaxID=2975872 RepID=UPI00386B6649
MGALRFHRKRIAEESPECFVLDLAACGRKGRAARAGRICGMTSTFHQEHPDAEKDLG